MHSFMTALASPCESNSPAVCLTKHSCNKNTQETWNGPKEHSFEKLTGPVLHSFKRLRVNTQKARITAECNNILHLVCLQTQQGMDKQTGWNLRGEELHKSRNDGNASDFHSYKQACPRVLTSTLHSAWPTAGRLHLHDNKAINCFKHYCNKQ